MTKINSLLFETKQNLGSRTTAALISALIVNSLVAVGCSKPSTPISQVPSPTNQAILNQVPVSTPDNSGTLTPASVPDKKKEVRKHRSVVTYHDQANGVSFRYPWIYSQSRGKQSELVASGAMDFAQPGGRAEVAIGLPKGLYPGTDLSSAFFRVNVNKKLTAEECDQFGLPQLSLNDQEDVQASNPGLEGLQLQEVEEDHETRHADTRYYHVFKNDACYEFALGMATEGDSDDDGVKPVNRDKVFDRLESILAAVTIESKNAPEAGVVAPTTSTLGEAGNQ